MSRCYTTNDTQRWSNENDENDFRMHNVYYLRLNNQPASIQAAITLLTTILSFIENQNSSHINDVRAWFKCKWKNEKMLRNVTVCVLSKWQLHAKNPFNKHVFNFNKSNESHNIAPNYNDMKAWWQHNTLHAKLIH